MLDSLFLQINQSTINVLTSLLKGECASILRFVIRFSRETFPNLGCYLKPFTILKVNTYLKPHLHRLILPF